MKTTLRVFHGSPLPDLTMLRAGSYVAAFRNDAELMGRFYIATGKTWSDDDLAEPHIFGKPAKFKEGREPDGKPTIYVADVSLSLLEIIDWNPYEFKITQPVFVTVV